jgi:PKD repeat protein
LQLNGHNQVLDVLDSSTAPTSNVETISLQLPAHSVKVLKVVDTSIPAAAPSISVKIPDKGEAGADLQFSAEADPQGVPALSFRWDFGDGTHTDSARVTHAYTHAGDFAVRLVAVGLDGIPYEKSASITVSGKINTRFDPKKKIRLEDRQ